MGRSRFQVATALGLALLGVAAGPAAAADEPAVTVSPSGAARFAWTRYPTGQVPPAVITTRGLSGGTLDAPQDLSPAEDCDDEILAGRPEVVLSEGGDSWTAWTQDETGACGGIFARHRQADRTLDPTRVVSLGAAFQPGADLAATPDGGAISVAQGRGLVATRLHPDGSASAPIILTTDRMYQPSLAVVPNGDVVFAWEKIRRGMGRVRTRILRADGSLTPVKEVSGASPLRAGGLTPQVAVDGTGRTTFMWRQAEGSNVIALTRIRKASGAFGLIHQLTEPGTEEGSAANTLGLAVDATGRAVFLWDWQRDWLSEGPIFVQARTRSAAGAFGPLLRVSGTGRDAVASDVAIDADGNAALGWERFDGSNWIAQTRRLAAPTSALGAVKNLSPAGTDADEVRVAVTPTGAAVFAWTAGKTPLDPLHCEACGIEGRQVGAGGSPGSVLDVG